MHITQSIRNIRESEEAKHFKCCCVSVFGHHGGTASNARASLQEGPGFDSQAGLSLSVWSFMFS